jgi:hypothetical protein
LKGFVLIRCNPGDDESVESVAEKLRLSQNGFVKTVDWVRSTECNIIVTVNGDSEEAIGNMVDSEIAPIPEVQIARLSLAYPLSG